MKRTTLKDVAEAAGVSPTVVSVVVNNKPDGYRNISIRPEVRTKVKMLAEKMSYRPHRTARALKTGKNKTIGMVTVHTDNPIHFHRNQALCNEILERGYDYIIQQISFLEYKHLQKAIDLFLDESVEGVVLSGLEFGYDQLDTIRQLVQMGVPTVEASPISHGDVPYIAADYYTASYELAKAVLAKGCKNVFVVTANFNYDMRISRRIEGARDACESKKGVSFNIFAPMELVTGRDTSQGYHSTVELLHHHEPDAILYTSDFYAIGGVKAFKEKGFRIPEDIKICGFDGIEVASFIDPPITTAVQPVKEIAGKAVEILFDMIEGRMTVSKAGFILPCEIVLRESTGHVSTANTSAK